jgi:molybdenum cofactor biosynthesis enzyme MoaA
MSALLRNFWRGRERPRGWRVGTTHSRQPVYQGHIDVAHGGSLKGWAADLNDLSRTLEVEVIASGAIVSRVRADLFRSDLLEHGIGTGHHAYVVDLDLPPGAVRRVQLKIAGTDHYLTYQGVPEVTLEGGVFIEFVAADVVNNCNLRCPFCVVDYGRVHTTDLMKDQTFSNLTRVLGAVAPQGFWLSCLHEPTLHPRLANLIELIPEEHRTKTWFTTNLARPLATTEFERWTAAGIHHVNVSFDTRDPQLFSYLRKHGRFHVFQENVRRLVTAVRNQQSPMLLRFITMAFQSNYRELPELVRFCHEQCGAFECEIRYTFNMTHIADEFRRTEYLRREQWAELDSILSALPYRVLLRKPPSERYEEIEEPSANFGPISSEARKQVVPSCVPLQLRARPDGSILLHGQEHHWSVNVNESEDILGELRSLVDARVRGRAEEKLAL